MELAYIEWAEAERVNYKETMNLPNVDQWRASCWDKFNTLKGYNTWMLVDKPPDISIVGSRWMFRVKRDNLGHVDKLKSRLVAQGYSQILGLNFNETYSPTIRFT